MGKKSRSKGLKGHNKYIFQDNNINTRKKAVVIEEIFIDDAEDNADIEEVEEVTLEDDTENTSEEKDTEEIIIEREIIDVSETEDVFSDGDKGSSRSVFSTDADDSDNEDHSLQSSLSGLSEDSDGERSITEEKMPIRDTEFKSEASKSEPLKIDYQSDDSSHQFEMQEMIWRSFNDEFPKEKVNPDKTYFKKIGIVKQTRPRIKPITAQIENSTENKNVAYNDKSSETKKPTDDNEDNVSVNSGSHHSIVDLFSDEDSASDSEHFKDPESSSSADEAHADEGHAFKNCIEEINIQDPETVIVTEDGKENLSYHCDNSENKSIEEKSPNKDPLELTSKGPSADEAHADEGHASRNIIEEINIIQETETVIITLDGKDNCDNSENKSTEEKSSDENPLDITSKRLNVDDEVSKTENNAENTEIWMLIKDPNVLFFCPKCGFKRKCGDYIRGSTCFCGTKYKCKRFRCELCEIFFTSNYLLNNHLEQHISEGKIPVNNVNRKYGCDICRRRFSTKNSISQHMRCHNRSFKCELCDKTFSKNIALKQHMSFHNSLKQITLNDKISERKYLAKYFGSSMKMRKCKLCDETFYKKRHLKNHLLSHVYNKKRKCKFCYETFYKKRDLRKHLLSHTSSKNEKCNFCGIYYENSDMKSHICVIEIND